MIGQRRESTVLCEGALGMFRDQSTGMFRGSDIAENVLFWSLSYEGRIREVTTRALRRLATTRETGKSIGTPRSARDRRSCGSPAIDRTRPFDKPMSTRAGLPCRRVSRDAVPM
jgi:hypothetical protein